MNSNNDTFAVFDQFWKNMGSFVPPTNEEEIDRKILEYRTVEQWLSMQVGLLQMTIQSLELQKVGLRTFKQGMQPTQSTED